MKRKLNWINKFNVVMVSFSVNNKCLQIRTKFSFTLVRYYSTHDNTVKPLDPIWLTGFTDGEGCFRVSIIEDKKI